MPATTVYPGSPPDVCLFCVTSLGEEPAWQDLDMAKIEDRPAALVVTGPPASGKSTVGAALAGELGAALIDQDIALWTQLDSRMLVWVQGLIDRGVKVGLLSNMVPEIGRHRILGGGGCGDLRGGAALHLPLALRGSQRSPRPQAGRREDHERDDPQDGRDRADHDLERHVRDDRQHLLLRQPEEQPAQDTARYAMRHGDSVAVVLLRVIEPATQPRRDRLEPLPLRRIEEP